MTSEEQERERLEKFVEMGTKYKNVFSGTEGDEVLEHIIFDILGTFRNDKKTEGDMELSNAGATILNYVACSDVKLTSKTIIQKTRDGIKGIIKAVIEVSPITANKGG